jgi:hypothetical protein
VDKSPIVELIDLKLPAEEGGFAGFIATRRMPGPDWQSFERVAQELYAMTGMSMTRSRVQHWGKKFGIPMWRPTKLRPEPTPEQVRDYRKAVAKYLP